ncbi:MAG: hypothetical protein ING66_09485 [Rhodocyclaceae bacterium]|nr:hypothetical protein [Rhodocyclaceae bacterium]MCA3034490.1 hypothetical protein [Rhodocyclaceae bacterium]MCA3082837.1 hypothetical protein [Rhodocyclaceae bacterium]
MNLLRLFLLLSLAPGVFGASNVLAQGLSVYKHVDPTGRTTYSNLPIKGAKVVELSPLTVLPKSQTVTIAAVPQVPPVGARPNPPTLSEAEARQPSALSQTSFETSAAQVETLQQMAPNPSVAGPSPAAASVPKATSSESRRTPGTATHGGADTAIASQRRREEVRRRIIVAEIDAEAQLLGEAQASLQRAQSKSVTMRSLRAAIVLVERAVAGKQTLGDDNAATKMVVERHFERVRELQDRVLTHEENLAELTAQLRAPARSAALKTAGTAPSTAIVSTAQLGGPGGN